MKITHLCLAGTVTDGWSYQENLLTKYHRVLGHEVSLITSKWVYDNQGRLVKSPFEDYYLENGVHVIRLEISNKDSLHYRFKKYSGIYHTLEALNPDVLFIHGVQFRDIKVIVRFLKNHPQVRTFVDNHADFSNSAKGFLSKIVLHKIIWRYYAHLILPYVSKFYGVLPARVDFLRDIYGLPKEKTELLVMGGDDELIVKASNNRKTTRDSYNIPNNCFLIVTGGKIDKWKTQTLLLMKAVRKMNCNSVRLIVFGPIDPELKEDMMSLVDSATVQYLGWLDSSCTYDLFAAADLVVFPGRHSVYWEQVAAQGIPMIVKDWEGTHHIDINGNVIFLKEDSVKEIQSQIEFLIKNQNKYQTMLSKAQAAQPFFSYKAIAERSIQI